MHTHPEQMKQREKHTRYPLELFFLLTKRGNKRQKKVKKTSSTMNTEGKKSIGQIVSTKIRTKKQNSIPIWNKIPSYTLPCLSDQWLKSFLQAFKPDKEQKKRDLVWGEVTVFFQASCASLRVGFFQCCWQWGEALWWLMLLRAPVWCSNCLSRCSPGLRCPARRWTRPSQESLLSTAARLLENKSETQERQPMKWNTLVKDDN